MSRAFHKVYPVLALSMVLTACGLRVNGETTPPQTPVPTNTQEATPASDPIQPSSLVFPHITGDAGNFALQAGETIAITWENAPAGADRYEFALFPLNGDPDIVLGIDREDADGVAISWTVTEHVAAELHATAYFSDGRIVDLYPPTIYSGDLPPAGVCSLIARHQPVEIYRLPDRSSQIFAVLNPGVYAPVLESAPDGWYRIDARAGQLYTPPLGGLPDSGAHDVAGRSTLIFYSSADRQDGWVNNDRGVMLVGSCPP